MSASTLCGLLRPGDKLIVTYEGDPGYGHERLVLWPAFAGDDGADEYVILTAGGDMYSEALTDWKDVIIMTGKSTYPTTGVPAELVQFALPMERGAVLREIKRGRAEARNLRRSEPARKVAEVPTGGFDWHGKALDLPKVSWLDNLRVDVVPGRRMKSKTEPIAPAKMREEMPPPVSPDLKAAEGYVWLLAESVATLAAGTEVEMDPTCVVLGNKAIFVQGSLSAFAEQVALGAVPTYVADKKRAWSAEPPVDSPEPSAPPSSILRERLGVPAPDAGGEPPSTQAPKTEDAPEDIRTLWVDVDEHGIRHKGWKEVLVESWHEPFAPGEGARLRGPATTLQLMRALEPDPRTWLEKWRQIKKLEVTDRVMHELTVLIDAVQAGGCYDCLNLPSLLTFEILVRRIYQVTDAYSVPGRVSWANSKYFRGTTSVDEVVPAEMRSYVHRESRAEVELAAARSRQQSLSGGGAGAQQSAADDGLGVDDGGGPQLPAGDSPAAPRGKGARRGGGGRGQRTRSATAAAAP